MHIKYTDLFSLMSIHIILIIKYTYLTTVTVCSRVSWPQKNPLTFFSSFQSLAFQEENHHSDMFFHMFILYILELHINVFLCVWLLPFTIMFWRFPSIVYVSVVYHLFGYAKIFLLIPLFVDIRTAFSFQRLWIKLLWRVLHDALVDW